MRVRFHPGAAADLTSAGDWYELQVPGLGPDLADEADRALEAIAVRPTTWPLWPGIGEGVGVRRFLLARFPFAVGYLPSGRASAPARALRPSRRREAVVRLRGAVRQALSSGLAPPHRRRRYARASRIKLNGVSATRRTRLKPASPSTSRRRASPAWAPRAVPTSCESEAGVHSSVEKP